MRLPLLATRWAAIGAVSEHEKDETGQCPREDRDDPGMEAGGKEHQPRTDRTGLGGRVHVRVVDIPGRRTRAERREESEDAAGTIPGHHILLR